MTDEGTLGKFLGIEIKCISKKTCELNQPHLVKRIVKHARLQETGDQKRTKSAGKPFLLKDQKGAPRKKEFNCRAVVGMLDYLQGSTRTDMPMAVYQCAIFGKDPKLSHERVIQTIVRHLLPTKSNGL